IATPLYPPELGGPATYASILMELLPREGVTPVLVKFSDVRHLPKILRHLAYTWRVLRAGKNADALLALDPVSVGWPVLVANMLLRKPLVVKVVGDHVWEQGSQRFGITGPLDTFPRFSPRWHPYLWLLRALQLIVVHNARVVIVPSAYLKSIVRG